MHLIHTTMPSGWHWGTEEQFYDEDDVPQLNHPPKWPIRPTNYDWVMSELAVDAVDDKYLP